MNETNLIQVLFNSTNMDISLVLNLWAAIAAAGAIMLVILLLHALRNNGAVSREVVPVRFTYSMGGAEIEYQIARDYASVEIAHRVYVELVTRKAAIPIDEERDVIVEVYNSWYSLFQIVRDELKKIPGKALRGNKSSSDLIGLLTDLLNLGLRPHLTRYQALFRKWYAEQLESTSTKGMTPQQIQQSYTGYDELVASVKEVNTMLIKYAAELKRIVGGN